MLILAGVVLGLAAWFLMRIVLLGVYTVDQNERAVKTRFGRAVRVPGAKTTLDDPIAEFLRPEERSRYSYPQVRENRRGRRVRMKASYSMRFHTGFLQVAVSKTLRRSSVQHSPKSSAPDRSRYSTKENGWAAH